MSYQYHIEQGRPRKTDWERCQEIARFVDRAKTKPEGSVEHKRNKGAAVETLRVTLNNILAGTLKGASDEVIVRKLMKLKGKIKELIKELP